MKRKEATGLKESSGNPFGHYRRRPKLEDFQECIERRGDAAVLREFLNDTATWVMANFSPIELEVHQAASLGRAARDKNEKLDYQAAKTQFPRLAILATENDWQAIVGSNPKPKEVTAAMLSRVLHREESSIKRWGQGKK